MFGFTPRPGDVVLPRHVEGGRKGRGQTSTCYTVGTAARTSPRGDWRVEGCRERWASPGCAQHGGKALSQHPAGPAPSHLCCQDSLRCSPTCPGGLQTPEGPSAPSSAL
ncbi:hypothetical protein GHT09_007248 [Marmota monax]|uniref:Uncharacterized protein n=1 Tax=Marmota monax TaxID=9995 RepID=A0A834QPQ1_MARMO|nr:hypothetical protein GHT09_007248 [Marmota monax]